MSRFKGIAVGCGLALTSTASPVLAQERTRPSPSIGNALTDCLHRDRLSLFQAHVAADTDGNRQAILDGFVATASGKAEVIESVRSTKGEVANNGKANCAAGSRRGG